MILFMVREKPMFRNIVGKYFFGVELYLTDGKITGSMRYSSFPYHAAATILNQIDSLLLAYYTQNMNRSIITTNAPISVAMNSTFKSSDLNFLNCIEGIPFSYLDLINGIKFIEF